MQGSSVQPADGAVCLAGHQEQLNNKGSMTGWPFSRGGGGIPGMSMLQDAAVCLMADAFTVLMTMQQIEVGREAVGLPCIAVRALECGAGS